MDEGPWYPEAKSILDLAQVRKLHLVLDVGSGFGDVTSEALERGADVISLDFSVRYLSIVAKLKRANPVLADATLMPFRDSVFDRVISKCVWHNISGRDARTRFVLEISRVSKKRGLIVLSAVWNRLYGFLNPKRLLLKRPKDDSHHHYFSPWEVNSIFRLAMLRIVGVQASKMPFRNSLPLINRFMSPWFSSFYLDISASKM